MLYSWYQRNGADIVISAQSWNWRTECIGNQLSEMVSYLKLHIYDLKTGEWVQLLNLMTKTYKNDSKNPDFSFAISRSEEVTQNIPIGAHPNVLMERWLTLPWFGIFLVQNNKVPHCYSLVPWGAYMTLCWVNSRCTILLASGIMCFDGGLY